jgi:predicted alpha/beta-hydrolase family hydrolase
VTPENVMQIEVGPRVGSVSAILERPPDAKALYVFAHGAGAGMRHAFMEAVVRRLSERGVGTLRYQFPYMEPRAEGKRGGRPDPPAVLTATVRAACRTGAELAKGVPLFAGGKSMGGRMTSLAASEGALGGPATGGTTASGAVRGLVFFGFPLHAAGRPSADRAAHLDAVDPPMLFLQGTRDSLADLALLRPVCDRLGSRSTLHVVEGADHSFHVKKSTGRTDDDVLDELADTTMRWMGSVAPVR